MGEQEKVVGPIAEGIDRFKLDHETYFAIMYQANMVEWPEDQQNYTLIHREGTQGFEAGGVSDDAPWALMMATFQPLPGFPGGEYPAEAKDGRTEGMEGYNVYCGQQVGEAKSPGRGQGAADVAGIKIVGEVDPSDIVQGLVGDCWFLSGLSSLAEFDGAVLRLFRNTPGGIEGRPAAGPNSYTVTLWDCATWTEVDIVVDERLATPPGGGQGLLGCGPSVTGELWACYVEKAVAIHCGGWDKIDGGQCTHAWALLTGCKELYTISEDSPGMYRCYGKYNSDEERWEPRANSPHDGFQFLWSMPWPDLGGGGESGEPIDTDDLFERLAAWDAGNYILAAGTKAGDDSDATGGIVDGHAYSILTIARNAAGHDDIDLIKMRNPHGSGEIDSGEWGDEGPGWDRYPDVKAALSPEVKDDGIFWVSKGEFFQYFKTIYVCAKDMTAFKDD